MNTNETTMNAAGTMNAIVNRVPHIILLVVGQT